MSEAVDWKPTHLEAIQEAWHEFAASATYLRASVAILSRLLPNAGEMRQLRARFGDKLPLWVLARMFGVSKWTAADLCAGRAHRDV